MFATRFDLFGTDDTVTRPILIGLVKDIQKLLNIEHDIYTTYDIKDNIPRKHNKLGDIIGNNTTIDEMINIEYEETSKDNHGVSLVVMRPDFKPIYVDPEIHTKFTPIYHARRLNIRFRYNNKSKAKVYALINKLRVYPATDAMYMMHDYEYHYVIPNYICLMLLHFNELKNKRLDNCLTLEEYINNTFDDRVDFSHTLDGNSSKTSLVIREAQLYNQGAIEDDLTGITPEYDDGTSSYSFEFNYVVYFEKPIMLLLEYPLMVYNTVIDKQFRTFSKEIIDFNKRAAHTTRYIGIRDTVLNIHPWDITNNNYFLTIPKIDNIQLPKPLENTARMFSVLVQVDPNDLTLLFNINNLSADFKLRDHVKKFILEEEREHIGERYESVFYVELFSHTEKVYDNIVIMEEDGTLRTTKPMDLKQTYRVVFNVTTDLKFLSKNASLRLRAYIDQEIKDLSNIRKPEEALTFQQRLHTYDVDYSRRNLRVESESIIETYLTLLDVDLLKQNELLRYKPHEIMFKLDSGLWVDFYLTNKFMILAALFTEIPVEEEKRR